MQLSWLGQFNVTCPPGTVRDLQSGFCFPVPPQQPLIKVPLVTLTPAPTAEEKRNQMLLIAAGIAAAGLLAYLVLR